MTEFKVGDYVFCFVVGWCEVRFEGNTYYFITAIPLGDARKLGKLYTLEGKANDADLFPSLLTEAQANLLGHVSPKRKETPEALLKLIQKTLEDNQNVLDRMKDLLN